MSEQTNAAYEKARDEAIRALVLEGGLKPEQVSSLKLNQLHLATNRLVVEPDEFDPSSTAGQEVIDLKLDAKMQRALINWLVVRPDGPNDHLFPGAGQEGLDVATIERAAAPKKPTQPPESSEATDAEAPPDKPVGMPEPIAHRERKERPATPPPAAAQTEEPQAVPLEEIESLRRRLAETYDAWSPAVTSPRVEPAREREVPPPPPVEAEPPAEVTDWEALPLEEDELELAEMPSPRARPGEAVPTLAPRVGVRDKLKGLLESGEGEVTLSYRILAVGGLALVIVLCCVGLVVAGGTLLGAGGVADLLAGATPSETEVPTEIVSSATFTPPPPPTPTGTPALSSTVAPSATFTPPPAPTNTPAPTPTPMVIVVTATPTPEPLPTATPEVTNTPTGSALLEPTATPAPALKYPAPTLLEPEDRSVVPGVINYLKWESVGPLADDEWYAVRLIFFQQGKPVYEGDQTKIPEWQVPERFYYQADGPALGYRWFVFVERQNSDGSTTQLSPESETFFFRWE